MAGEKEDSSKYSTTTKNKGLGDSSLEDVPINVVLKDIFSNCDQENAGEAHAKKLIEFITPYLENNPMELAYLKKCLDPNDLNPLIDEERFFHIMQKWVSKFEETYNSPEGLRDFDSTSVLHSSPKTNWNNNFFKSNPDTAAMNVSTTSNGSIGNVITELATLQETASELEHQNRKLLEELGLVRSQLSITEEQNESLQADLEKLNRKLQTEQQINEKLRAERKENEELRESAEAMAKKIKTLEKLCSNADKETTYYKQQLEKMEKENQKLEAKLEQAKKREAEKEKALAKIRTEYDFKEAVVSSLENKVFALQDKLKDQEQIIEHHVEVNESLKVEKITLEKLLRSQVSQSYSLPSRPMLPNVSPLIPPPSGTFPLSIFLSRSVPNSSVLSKTVSAPVSPLKNPSPKKDSDKWAVQFSSSPFNTPRLKKMLEHPVTPNLSQPDMSTAGQFNDSLNNNIVRAENGTSMGRGRRDSFPIEPSVGETRFFKQYRLMGDSTAAASNTSIVSDSVPKLRPPKNSEIELPAKDSPTKEVSPRQFLHDSSEDDITVETAMLTQRAMCVQQSLQYELAQIPYSNELADHSKNVIEQLQREKEALESSLELYKEDIRNLKDELYVAKQNEAKLEERKRDLEDELKYFREEVQDLKNKNAESRKRISELQDLDQDLQVQCKNYSKNITELKTNMKELLEDNNSLSVIVDELRKENLKTMNEIDDLKATTIERSELEKNHKEIENTIIEKQALEEKLTHYQHKIKKLEEKLSNKISDYDRLKEELETARKMHDQATADAEKLSDALIDKEETINTLRQEIQELKNNIISKEKPMEELKREISSLKHSLTLKECVTQDFERERSQLQESINDLKHKHAVLKETISSKEDAEKIIFEDINDLKRSLAKKEDLSRKLQDDIARLTVVVEEKETTIVKLQNDLSTKEEAIKTLKQETCHLSDRLRIQKQSIKSFEAEIQELTASFDLQLSHIDTLTREINQLKESVKDKDTAYSHLQKEFKNLENLCQQKTSDIEELNTSIKKKEEAIKSFEEQIVQLSTMLTKKQQSVDSLEKELYKSKQEEGKVPKGGCSFNRLNLKIEKMKQKIETLENHLQIEKTNKEKVLAEKAHLVNEVATLEKFISDLEKKLETQRNEATASDLGKRAFKTLVAGQESPDSPSANLGEPEFQKQKDSSFRGKREVSEIFVNRISTEQEEELSISEVSPRLGDVLQNFNVNPQEKEGIRQKFQAFVLAFTVDASTICTRMQRHKRHMQFLENVLSEEVAKLRNLLEQLQEENKDPGLQSCIVASQLQLRTVMDSVSKVIVTSMQSGTLSQEQRTIHSLCLLIKYVSLIERNIESTARSQTVRSSKSTSSQSITIYEDIRSVLSFSSDSGGERDDRIDENVSVIVNTRYPRWMTFMLRCRRLVRQNFVHRLYSLITFLLCTYAIIIILENCFNRVLWNSSLYDDLFSPFFKIEYSPGPRPM